jgi:hypothetical protein
MKELLPFIPTPITGLSTKLCVELAAMDILRRRAPDRGRYFAEAIRFLKKKANKRIGLDQNHPDAPSWNNVETWFDRKSRNWITQTKDAAGNSDGRDLICGDITTAATNHAERCVEVAGALVTDPFIVKKAEALLAKRGFTA